MPLGDGGPAAMLGAELGSVSLAEIGGRCGEQRRPLLSVATVAKLPETHGSSTCSG